MFSTRQTENPRTRPYAIAADFCRIFENDMNRLYLLSYLLTADQRTAEECFVRGLDDATRSNNVFREWAGTWARRMIIQNAISMVRPRRSGDETTSLPAEAASSYPGPIPAVVSLPAFERFVFVMSVLEQFSPQECSLLLGCRREDVIAARIRALGLLGGAAQQLQEPRRVTSHEPAALHLAVWA